VCLKSRLSLFCANEIILVSQINGHSPLWVDSHTTRIDGWTIGMGMHATNYSIQQNSIMLPPTTNSDTPQIHTSSTKLRATFPSQDSPLPHQPISMDVEPNPATHIISIPILYDSRQTHRLSFRLLRLPLLKPDLSVTTLTPSSSCHIPLLHLPSTVVHKPDDPTRIKHTTHLFSFPTLTVAIILSSAPGRLRAKHVNSKKLECSE
jgi:hypothetical protein